MRRPTWLAAVLLLVPISACAPSAQEVDAADGTNVAAIGGKADAEAYHLGFSPPASLVAGDPATLRFTVRDDTGARVTSFTADHTKLFHLIVVSQDLSYFTHVHPSYAGDGAFTVSWTPPELGDDYYLYAQVHPSASDELLFRLPLSVPGTAEKSPVPLVADTDDMKMDGSTMIMIERPDGGFHVGSQKVGFMIEDSATGNMVNDLQPFLGARAHLVAIKGDAHGTVFLHEHDMGDMGHMAGMGGMAMAGDAMSGDAFDPAGMLSFDVDLPSSGIYRLWAQYRRLDQDVTESFTITVP